MELSAIIQASATRMKQVKIEVDTRFEIVEITDLTGVYDDIFLQGEDAYEFICEAQELWERAQTVGITECYAHLAESYCESFWH